MTDKEKKKNAIKIGFDLKNGNPTVTVSNWLKALLTPVGIGILAVLVIIWMSLGNVKSSMDAIRHLPEVCDRVNALDETVNKHERKLNEHSNRIFALELREQMSREN